MDEIKTFAHLAHSRRRPPDFPPLSHQPNSCFCCLAIMKESEFVRAPTARCLARLVRSEEHVGYREQPMQLGVNRGRRPATCRDQRPADSSRTRLATAASVGALNFFGIAQGPNFGDVGRRKRIVVQDLPRLNGLQNSLGTIRNSGHHSNQKRVSLGNRTGEHH